MGQIKSGTIAKAVATHNATASKEQVKPVDTGADDAKRQKAVLAYWKALETATNAPMIAAHLRTATRTNGGERRQWCLDNGATVLDISTIVRRSVSNRPENTLRERLSTLSSVKGCAFIGKLGYLRVLDSATALANPSDPRANLVYIYRTA
jgi:hypothetical protein